MPDLPRRGSWLVALLTAVAIPSVLAQGSAVDEIAKYRAALQDGNPAELWEALEPFVPDYDAILMANHGVVAYGANLHQAYMKMETVEHFAQITLVTQMLGRQEPLGPEEVEKLIAARSKYQGAKSAARLPVGIPYEEPSADFPERSAKRRTITRQR